MEVDNVPVFVQKGEIAREGSEVLARAPQHFDPIEGHVRYDVSRGSVEAATAGPGEQRGEPTYKELSDRAQELEIEGRSQMNKAELAKAVAKAEKAK